MPESDNEKYPTNKEIGAAWLKKSETAGAMVVLRLKGVLGKGKWGKIAMQGQIFTKKPTGKDVRVFCANPECIEYAFAVFDEAALANYLGQFYEQRGHGGKDAAEALEILKMHPFLKSIRDYCTNNPHPTAPDLVTLKNSVGQSGNGHSRRKPKNQQPPHSSDQLPWSNQQHTADSHTFWLTNQWFSRTATGPDASPWHQPQQQFGWPQPQAQYWSAGASLQPFPPVQQPFYNGWSLSGSLAPPQLEATRFTEDSLHQEPRTGGANHVRRNVHKRLHVPAVVSERPQTSPGETKTAPKSPSGLTEGSLRQEPQTSRINHAQRNAHKRQHPQAAAPAGAQTSPGGPETAQKRPGDARQARGGTGEPCRAQESPKPRRPKSAPPRGRHEEVDEASTGKGSYEGVDEALIGNGKAPWRQVENNKWKALYYRRYEHHSSKRAKTNHSGIHM